jgi:nucleotide-binding universal stress UspA family protein
VIGTTPADARNRAIDLLASAVAAAGVAHPGVAVAEEAVEGPPARVLTDTARDADLLVLGSHGHGRLFHAVVGSVADACIRAATCPVVVAPTPRQGRVPAPAEVVPAPTAR